MKIEKRRVTIRTTTDMLGTVPKNKDVYSAFIETKKVNNKNGEVREENESATVESIEEKGWTGFHKDETTGKLFIYEYMILGFLKNAGEVLQQNIIIEKAKGRGGATIVKEPLKAARSKLDRYLFVEPRKIFLGGATEPDGELERPLRAQTAMGPRVTVARSDYMKEGLELTFTLKLLKNKEISWEIIKELLDYGQLAGLGQFRNGGYGRFEVVSIEEVE